ncbi:MAG TPA: pantoate--beta-alanine ligase [Thermodesulfovibrionales bacterium]|nr:pantoate--beta-alanine ligase [Thermodesulfovibrionales bacterium]
MEIIRIPRIMQDTSGGHLLHGRTIGLVPTMGALHEGHLSLVRMAKAENSITVVSIFVNPRQFGPAEDFSRYPRDPEGDAEKLSREGIDILFSPDASLMYPAGFSTQVDVRGLSEGLCGMMRPDHFTGVATIVAKLFHIVRPTRAYFGQKDFQQTLVIKRMVRDLDMGLDVVVCPVIREVDGLAMSSRNAYLTQEERKAASAIHRSLLEASAAVKSGIIQGSSVKKLMMDVLGAEPLVSEVQYCSVYDPRTLNEVERINGEVLLALAVKIGNIRLIDNMLVSSGTGSASPANPLIP